MKANGFFAKFLRYTAIVLLGLTAGFTLLGGAGTSCVAFNPTGFSESMALLAPMQWLYVLFVLVGVALGVLGIRATVMLVKGRDKAYRDALVVLAAGVVVGAIHIAVSRALRGKSMPVDGVVYVTVLTLAIFLLLRIPAIWQAVDFSKGSARSNRPAGGATAIILGLLALSIQFWMESTHTWGGVNYADAFDTVMTLVGAVGILGGVGLLLPGRSAAFRERWAVDRER